MYDENLVLENINLVYFVLKKLNLYSKLDDYFDIGIIGLVKSAKNFDKNKGFKFSSYAIHIIQNEILYQIRKEHSLKQKINYNTLSLNTVIYNDGNDILLEDTIQNNVNIEQEYIKKQEIININKKINNLSEREQIILNHTYELNNYKKLNQVQLANKIGISQAQICRIKKQALNKIKEMVEV